MPFDLNRVELIGRLGREPEMRYTPDGKAVTTFRLATNRRGQPETNPQTDWHTIVCWDKLAEFAGEYLSKGRLVFIAGRLTYRSWEGRDGRPRWTAEVVANELIVLDHRPETAPADSPTPLDDDVPF